MCIIERQGRKHKNKTLYHPHDQICESNISTPKELNKDTKRFLFFLIPLQKIVSGNFDPSLVGYKSVFLVCILGK